MFKQLNKNEKVADENWPCLLCDQWRFDVLS
jgi:hypothetical protein